jgi:hypothetical protein
MMVMMKVANDNEHESNVLYVLYCFFQNKLKIFSREHTAIIYKTPIVKFIKKTLEYIDEIYREDYLYMEFVLLMIFLLNRL